MIWEFLVEAYDDFSWLVGFNILWAVFTILIITAPPAAAGLYHATNQLAHQNPVSWRTFFEGFRMHFWLSWRWGLTNLLVLAVLGINLQFYGQFDAGWSFWLQGVCLGLVGLWLLLQVYTFPLLLEQQDRRMRTALRNSLVLFVRRFGFSLGLSVFIGLIVVFSTFVLQPTWLLLTASLVAYLANQGVIYLIKTMPGSQPEGA